MKVRLPLSCKCLFYNINYLKIVKWLEGDMQIGGIKKPSPALSGGDDLLTRTCLSQRIFFIPLQKGRRGNTRRSAWCRAPVPISWM